MQLQLHPQSLNFTGDKTQLQQVILNLMTNASEAFPATFQGKKIITIQTNLKDDRIYLTVSDNGCGIAPEIESLVFDLLRTNKETGIGIGLWLSKTIVESHKGKIDFTTRTNFGTSFRVELPCTSGLMYF